MRRTNQLLKFLVMNFVIKQSEFAGLRKIGSRHSIHVTFPLDVD